MFERKYRKLQCCASNSAAEKGVPYFPWPQLWVRNTVEENLLVLSRESGEVFGNQLQQEARTGRFGRSSNQNAQVFGDEGTPKY